MKILITILFLSLLFGCKKNYKEQIIENNQLNKLASTAGCTGINCNYQFTSAVMPNYITNGVRTRTDVVKLGKERNISYYVWVSGSNGTYWVQAGYRCYNGQLSLMLMATQTGVSGFITLPELELIQNVSLIQNTKQTFSIYNETGTTKWIFAVDDTPVYRFNLFTDWMQNLTVATESDPTSRPQFNLINLNPAIQYLSNGTWLNPPWAYIQLDRGWGIEGSNQNAILLDNELNVGGNLLQYPTGGTNPLVYLWN